MEDAIPWQVGDVAAHNKSAKSKKAKENWVAVANSVLKQTGDEGRAIAAANSAVSKRFKNRGKG